MEDRLAEEIRKMEDSNGYLKKMYEEKINNYEKEISELKEKIKQDLAEIDALQRNVKKL